MSKNPQCCDGCKTGGECSGALLCRMVPFQPPTLDPVKRIDEDSGIEAPAGQITRMLYKPTDAVGYRPLLQSFGFRAPSTVVGLFVPTFLHVSIVPRDTGKLPTDPNFAGLTLNGQLLANAITGFQTFTGQGHGKTIPVDDNGRGWWVYVQIGTETILPLVPSGFNLSFAYTRTLQRFEP